MAGKGYNYADDFDEDWCDDVDEYYEEEDDAEDPELAAAVEAAKKFSLAGKSGKVCLPEPQACCLRFGHRNSRTIVLASHGKLALLRQLMNMHLRHL